MKKILELRVKTTRSLVPLFIVALLGFFAASTQAQTLAPNQISGYPSKALKLLVPFPPGGPTDIVARPIAQLLSEALKQPVVIENKGGAGGSIAAETIARSTPDGYSLLMGTVGTHAINQFLYKQLAYDPIKDFTPIALVASAPVVIVVNASHSARNLSDLVRLAKQKPNALSFGSAGNGSPGHLSGALFEAAAQIQLQHIPYKGSAPAVTDLLGGQIPLMFDPVQSVIAQITAGKLRALAVTGSKRSPVLPDVPTVAESGFAQFESTAWWAVFAPAKLPDAITKILRGEVEKIATSESFREKLGKLGVVPHTDFKESLFSFQQGEIIKWSKAVRDSGATVD